MTNNTTFKERLSTCPVTFDFLSDDSEGQIAYVFFTEEEQSGEEK